MTRQVKAYYPGDNERVRLALEDLRHALHLLKLTGSRRTADRVRLAISSAKGAVRNVNYRRIHAERRYSAGIMRVGELYQPTPELVEAQRRAQA